MKNQNFLRFVFVALLIGTMMLPMACDTDTSPDSDSDTEVPVIPDKTSVKFDGKTVWCQVGTGVGDTWRVFDFSWSDEYQNQIGKFTVTIGKDVLDQDKPRLLINLVKDINAASATECSEADLAALIAKFNAAMPADSGKNYESIPKEHHGIKIVAEYTP